MTEPSIINANVQLTERDLFRYGAYVTLKNARGYFLIVILFTFFLAFQYYRAWTSGSPERLNDEVHAAQNLLPLVLLFFLFPFVIIVASCLHLRSSFRSNRSLNCGLHYAFSQEGIETAGPTSQGLLRWDGLHRIEETRHAFLLFHDKKNAQVVPKRFFGESDLAALRALMKAHVAKVKLKP
jgi:YcxB-like protein